MLQTVLAVCMTLVLGVAGVVFVNDVSTPAAVDPAVDVVVRWTEAAVAFSVCVWERAFPRAEAACEQGYRQTFAFYPAQSFRALAFYEIELNLTLNTGQIVREESSFGTGPSESSFLAQSWLGGYTELVHTFKMPQLLGSTTRAVLYITSAGCYDAWVDGVQLSSIESSRFSYPVNKECQLKQPDRGLCIHPLRCQVMSRCLI